MGCLSKSDANNKLAKAKQPTKTRHIGELYPEVFRTDVDANCHGNDVIDVAIVYLGEGKINRYSVPRVECPNCKRQTLTPYSARGSWLSGSHVIKFYCSKCKESFAFNNMLGYFRMIAAKLLEMKKSSQQS